jgi:hypothetical protein
MKVMLKLELRDNNVRYAIRYYTHLADTICQGLGRATLGDSLPTHGLRG